MHGQSIHPDRVIILYLATSFLYWVANYLYVPTLPTYVLSRTGDLALVGSVLSMYGLWQAIIRLPVGIVSDVLGRPKVLIVIGLGLEALGTWLMGTADSLPAMAVGRAITGLACGTWVPLLVAYGNLFPPSEVVRATVILTLVGSIGKTLATSVTGWLNEAGGYSLAFFLAAVAALLAIVVVVPIPERVERPRGRSAASVGRLITRRDVVLPSFLSAVGQYALYATTFGFLPILAGQLGATDVFQSTLVATNIGLSTLGNLAATAVSRRVRCRHLTYLGFALLSLGIAVAATASSLTWIFVAQIGIGLGFGICYPVLMGLSIQQVAPSERATAMGLHQAVYAIGMFGGPWLSGLLANAIGIRSMFGVTALLCLGLGFWIIRGLAELD